MANESYEHSQHEHHEHAHGAHAAHTHEPAKHPSSEHHQGHKNGHAHMIDDFKKRCWITLALTVPVLLLTPMVQMFLGLGDSLRVTKPAKVPVSVR